MTDMKFGRDFIWGVSTSSYQVEGAAYLAGGGFSTWDMLCRQPGKIANGDNGDIACGHYERFRDDVALMSQIGVDAYRFSVSWPRVLPTGTGFINQKGLDFYSKLVDALLENNIEPWLTLFHWDYPYDLYCRGGWLNRDSADWFADYVSLIVDTLSDRVSQWITLNEPQCFISLGHLDGIHAPGLKMGMGEVLLAGHNALRAHGKAVQIIRQTAKQPPSISAAQANKVSIPNTDSAQDIEAARLHMYANPGDNLFSNSWFSDPMILGSYPEDGLRYFEHLMPKNFDSDLAVIHQDLDYFATNIYSGVHVRASEQGYEVVEQQRPVTAMGWPITPESLYWGPTFIHQRYGLPVVVTENGMARDDEVCNGKVHDNERVYYLYRYLDEYGRAIADGVPAKGYFHWSLMDNFEWAEGYTKRFGMVYVDYETLERTMKFSAQWYKRLIANHKKFVRTDGKTEFA